MYRLFIKDKIIRRKLKLWHCIDIFVKPLDITRYQRRYQATSFVIFFLTRQHNNLGSRLIHNWQANMTDLSGRHNHPTRSGWNIPPYLSNLYFNLSGLYINLSVIYVISGEISIYGSFTKDVHNFVFSQK